VADLAEELAAAREHRTGLQSRRAVLQDLEERREGVADAPRAAVDAGLGRLIADALHVNPALAHAVEAALDVRADWVLVDAVPTPEQLAALPGRVTFVPRDTVASAVGWASAHQPHASGRKLAPDGGLKPTLQEADSAVGWAPAHHPNAAAAPDAGGGPGPALQDVSHARDERSLGLRPVSPEPDWKTRSDLAEHVTSDEPGLVAWLFSDYRTGGNGPGTVADDGTVRHPDGRVTGGPRGVGVVQRRATVEQLDAAVGEAEAAVERLQAKLAGEDDAARQAAERAATARGQAYAAASTASSAKAKQAAAEDAVAAAERRKPTTQAEVDRVAQQTAALRDEREQLANERASAEAERLALAETPEDEAEVDAAAVEAATEAAAAARVTRSEAAARVDAARRAAAAREARERELRQRLDRLEATRAAAERRVGEAEADAAAAEAEQAKHAEQAEEARRAAATSAQDATAAEQDAAAASSHVDAASADRTEADERRQLADAAGKEAAVRREVVIERARDEAELDVAALYADSYEEPADADWPAMSAEAKQLRERIQRIGSVNLDAIDELEQLETRRSDLTKQADDVSAARDELVTLIEKLDRESNERFAETFEATRREFNGLFRRLFGGGKADLVLQQEVTVRQAGELVTKRLEPSEAGVEVVARPPGKQPASMTQLSGGEKTMTCVALLLSLFRSRPSPVCVLDEVDAALDEANTERFVAALREFTADSQFVVVTHAKPTMRAADVLYGVTMPEQGVSKRVAVTFDRHGEAAF
jgi:chromosome segregation protein